MRKVEIVHQALGQLLERTTLDVYAGRRSVSQSRELNTAFNTLFRRLQDSSLGPSDFGRATRYFFGLFQNRNRRVINQRLSFGTMVVVVQFDNSTDDCAIGSIELA